ncbi:alkene reductase [Phyllobacterium pellucidum]|uniref:alkene reductase n=1 Tax=Phyllobacterium pellucidum TaxID=2740464 RepID=UPI001D1528D5|nr:alkene reductase [Phyllobacterium sp. T1018]UGY08615.1 alkene reductase [Phyllobacterium sp. T1018]
MSAPCLFAPMTFGDLSLSNRIVMAPMTRRRAMHGKIPSELNALYYRQRAGAGLIISESIEVDPFSTIDVPTRPGLTNSAQESGWRLVTDAVHGAGGKIFAQLSHMGRTAHPSQLLDGRQPVGPSALAASGTIYTSTGPEPYATPRALEIPEIGTIVAEFAAAARRARSAGFDGIEIHGANGYLIDQFLRDGSNIRTDRYGGSVSNRTRLLIEIIAATQMHWPAARVGVRLSPTNTYQGMSDSDPVGNFAGIAALLDPLGLAYLHIVEPIVQSIGQPRTLKGIRDTFGGTLIVAGGYGRADAENVLASGAADLVAVGEAFIANPDLPERWRLSAGLSAADKSTFYTSGERGYTDYPPLSAATD